MARNTHAYRLHAASGNAFIEINRKRTYLGKYNSEESLKAYARVLKDHRAKQKAKVIADEVDHGVDEITVAMLVKKYRVHVERWYVKDGKPKCARHFI